MLEENKNSFDEICNILVRNRDQNVTEKRTLMKDMRRFFGLDRIRV